jgi:hypothetical protein
MMVMSQVWQEMVPFVIKHIRSQLADGEWAMITMDQYGLLAAEPSRCA